MKEGRHIHKGIMVAAGPVVGLIFAVALPFVGVAALLWAVAGRVLGPAHTPAYATFGWRPSESYLAGRKKKN